MKLNIWNLCKNSGGATHTPCMYRNNKSRLSKRQNTNRCKRKHFGLHECTTERNTSYCLRVPFCVTYNNEGEEERDRGTNSFYANVAATSICFNWSSWFEYSIKICIFDMSINNLIRCYGENIYTFRSCWVVLWNVWGKVNGNFWQERPRKDLKILFTDS